MKNILEIPEYSLEIHIEGKKIQCVDQTTQEVTFTKTLKEPIIKVRKEKQNKYILTQSKEKKYTLFVTPEARIKSVILTKSCYILDLHLENPNHGFFFGLYQIGEFVLTRGNKINLIKTFSIKYCNKGCITPLNIMFLSLRESETLDGPHSYYLAKLNWNTLPEPSLIWKKPVLTPILAMHLVENNLFLGMKDGSLHLWDIKKEKLVKTIDLFDSPISTIEKGREKIITTSQTGDIVALSDEGILIWKKKLGNERISGVLEENESIHCVDYYGSYHQLNTTDGTIITQKNWNIGAFPDKSTLSNMIETKDWIIICSGGNLAGYWKKDVNKTFQWYRIYQPLVQQLIAHPNGFYTGDDEGRLMYWLLSPIYIKKGITTDDPSNFHVKETFPY
ncbi:MAG: hypothetical protein ACW964_15700 [Candidatus Hodarchaeales archaeon]|jgi:hypothetical protein